MMRFDITVDRDNLVVITDEGVELTPYQVKDLLNGFNEENIELKSFIKQLSSCGKIMLMDGSVYDVGDMND